MKAFFLSLFVAALFVSCDEGPVGPPGPQGLDGVNVVGQTFEFTADFAAPDYSAFFSFPNNVQVLNSDVVLAYILWEEAPANNGGVIDVWRPLPQTVYTANSQFAYNYDWTQGDITTFIDAAGNFDFNELTGTDLNNQVFRVVIVPSDFVATVDTSNLSEVLSAAGLSTQGIQGLE